MLSILIPTYNYNVLPLVKKIYQQITERNIDFEILVYDDCSPKEIIENREINSFENASYKVLETNRGRSRIRNLLADNAKYEWLLFLDADVKPIKDDFIKNYIRCLPEKYDIIYGGIKYTPAKPEVSKLLRWHYGNSRESLSCEKRNNKPYLSFLTLNFLIRKNIFKEVRFNEDIPNLRHEDTLFSYNLKNFGASILHINNPVYHLGVESSKEFLKKSIESVKGAVYLKKYHLIDLDYIKILSFHEKLRKLKLDYLVEYMLRKNLKQIKINLLGSKPSLFLFDLYRLYHLIKFEKNA